MDHGKMTSKPNELQPKRDFNFPIWLDVISFLSDDRYSNEDLCCTIASSITRKQFSNIIQAGLKSLFHQTRDFTLISKIQQALRNDLELIHTNDENLSQNQTQSNTKCNHIHSNSNVNGNKSSCIKVFKIQSLTCNIFEYLQFTSLLKCRRVNKQWFYDSYHPASISHMSIRDLFRVLRMQHDNQILKFKHIQSITVDSDNKKLLPIAPIAHVFENFVNIKHININMEHGEPSRAVQRIAQNIIENNLNNIQQLRAIGYEDTSQKYKFPDVIAAKIYSSKFNSLKKLILKNVTLNHSIDFNSLKNLQTLLVDESELGFKFWIKLIDNKCDLSNLRSLTFKKISIAWDSSLVIPFIPHIAEKLTNLEKLELIDSDKFWEKRNRVIEFIFGMLYYLSINKNNKLKILNICLYPQNFKRWIYLYKFNKRVNNQYSDLRLNFVDFNPKLICVYDIYTINFNQLENLTIEFLHSDNYHYNPHKIYTLAHHKDIDSTVRWQNVRTIETLLIADEKTQPSQLFKFILNLIRVGCSNNQNMKNIENENSESLLDDNNDDVNKDDDDEDDDSVVCLETDVSKLKKLAIIGWQEICTIDQLSTAFNVIKFVNLKQLICKQNQYYDIVLQQRKIKHTLRSMNHVNSMINMNMNSIANSSIKRIQIETRFDEYQANKDNYLKQLSIILSNWHKRADIDAQIVFYPQQITNGYKWQHFQFPQKMAMRLLRTLLTNSSDDDIASFLVKEKFVAPYYGGNQNYFYNKINEVENCSIEMIVKLEQEPEYQDDGGAELGFVDVVKKFYFVIRILSRI